MILQATILSIADILDSNPTPCDVVHLAFVSGKEEEGEPSASEGALRSTSGGSSGCPPPAEIMSVVVEEGGTEYVSCDELDHAPGPLLLAVHHQGKQLCRYPVDVRGTTTSEIVLEEQLPLTATTVLHLRLISLRYLPQLQEHSDLVVSLLMRLVPSSMNDAFGYTLTAGLHFVKEELRLALEDAVGTEERCSDILRQKDEEIAALKLKVKESVASQRPPAGPSSSGTSQSTPTRSTRVTGGTPPRGTRSPSPTLRGSSPMSRGASPQSSVARTHRAMEIENKELEIRILREKVSDLELALQQQLRGTALFEQGEYGHAPSPSVALGTYGRNRSAPVLPRSPQSKPLEASPAKKVTLSTTPKPTPTKKTPPPASRTSMTTPPPAASTSRTSPTTRTPPPSSPTAPSPKANATPASPGDDRSQRILRMEKTLAKLRKDREAQLRRMGIPSSPTAESTPQRTSSFPSNPSKTSSSHDVTPPMRRVSPLRVENSVDRLQGRSSPKPRRFPPPPASPKSRTSLTTPRTTTSAAGASRPTAGTGGTRSLASSTSSVGVRVGSPTARSVGTISGASTPRRTTPTPQSGTTTPRRTLTPTTVAGGATPRGGSSAAGTPKRVTPQGSFREGSSTTSSGHTVSVRIGFR